jgi:hypothetical protein
VREPPAHVYSCSSSAVISETADFASPNSIEVSGS